MEESVIAFGDEEPPRRRAFLRDLGRDRRLPGLLAGLAAVAAFGSLISEWQTTTIDGSMLGSDGGVLPDERVLLARLIDLGALGSGYLAGLLLLVVAVVLALAGPEPGRAYAKVTGLAVGGVLLALIVALVQHLSRTSVLVSEYYFVSGDDPVQVGHGRGLWCALAAVGLAMVVLWMPARALPAAPEPPAGEPDDALDMTITPTTPFASYPGELDQPHRS